MQKITPCGHRVLVKLKALVEKEEVTKGGIVIAQVGKATKAARQRAMQEAHVIAIGHTAFEAFGDEPWCQVGDLVLIVRHSGEDRVDEDTGDIYRVLNDEDICATLDESEV